VDYGSFIAVDDLTLSVPPGEVFGLVGPNGAGKTSTFRVLATLMEPTYGKVILGGVEVIEDIETARRIIGYMPDLAPVPADLMEGLIQPGIRMRAFEEKRSSFEDILVEVAETNRLP
jgi:ABC-2 type transport system ATP-binding protein